MHLFECGEVVLDVFRRELIRHADLEIGPGVHGVPVGWRCQDAFVLGGLVAHGFRVTEHSSALFLTTKLAKQLILNDLSDNTGRRQLPPASALLHADSSTELRSRTQ